MGLLPWECPHEDVEQAQVSRTEPPDLAGPHKTLPHGFTRAGARWGTRPLPNPFAQSLPPFKQEKGLPRSPHSLAYANKVCVLTQKPFLSQKLCSCKRNPLRFQYIASAVSFKKLTQKVN